MSSFTNFLNLFKWNAVEDGEEEFNIDKALNENWDKIDTKLETHIKGVNKEVSDFKTEVNATVQGLADGIEEGSFLPSGGTTGQVLAKVSEENGDVEWVNQTGGSAVTIKRWEGDA